MLGVLQKTWDTLEALVMDPAQLAAALSTLSEPTEEQADQLPGTAPSTEYAPRTESRLPAEMFSLARQAGNPCISRVAVHTVHSRRKVCGQKWAAKVAA